MYLDMTLLNTMDRILYESQRQGVIHNYIYITSLLELYIFANYDLKSNMISNKYNV